MEVAFENSGFAGFGAFFVLASLWGLFVTIFWMVTAWRAMRAHERFAEAIERYLGVNGSQTGHNESDSDTGNDPWDVASGRE